MFLFHVLERGGEAIRISEKPFKKRFVRSTTGETYLELSFCLKKIIEK
jgi:hypothetical protein